MWSQYWRRWRLAFAHAAIGEDSRAAAPQGPGDDIALEGEECRVQLRNVRKAADGSREGLPRQEVGVGVHAALAGPKVSRS